MTALRIVLPRHIRAYEAAMPNPKYVAQIENIFFLVRIGEALRWATNDIVREELPENVQHLLRRLDRVEVGEKAMRQEPDNDPAA